MQDASGDFLDEVGALDLADHGTPLYAQTGPVPDVKSIRFTTISTGGLDLTIKLPVGSYAVEFWVKPNFLEEYLLHIGTPQLTLDLTDGEHIQAVYQAVGVLGDSVTVLSTAEWYHVVCSKASAGAPTLLYINGQLDATFGTAQGRDNGFYVRIGNDANSTRGDYCLFAVYDAGLSAGDVSAHYDALFAEPQGASGLAGQLLTCAIC